MGKLGLNLGVYGGACYYGACDGWSLALGPYPSDEIKQAKLAVSTPSEKDRKAIVETFFAAANVTRDPKIDAGLNGHECCGRDGSKNITVSWFDRELVVSIME